jgi:replicative DNA helicase
MISETNILKLDDVEPKAAEFYLKDFLPLPKKAITMLSANGGSGKTFLAIQLALKLSSEGKKVLLWLSEDDKGIVKHRSKMIKDRVLKNSDIDSSNIDIIDEMPPHLNTKNYKELEELFCKYNVVVLDPLIAFFGGEENNNSQARFFMNLLNKIAKINLQSILLIHHSTKPSKDNAARTRGAGAFIDAVRLSYEIQNIDDDDVDNNKKRVAITKDNYGIKHIVNADYVDVDVLPFDVQIINDFSKNPGKIDTVFNANVKKEKQGVLNVSSDW